MKTLTLTAAALAAFAAGAGTATASADLRPQVPTLTILHLNVGCHSWSLNAGPYRAEQTVRLREGQSLRLINFDRFTHQLIQLSGGSLTLGNGSFLVRRPHAATIPLPPEPTDATTGVPQPKGDAGVLDHWGATATLTFNEPGSYLLGTVEGAAFATVEGTAFPGQRTESSGPNNTLTVRVLVFPQLHHPLP